MTNQTLQTIPISEIHPNIYQPRENFDKEYIEELAESILGNGLINPITVRKLDKGKYMIVTGESRWKAHKVAKLKKIDSFIKEYKNDGQWMIESLIENTHRKDLSLEEKGKYLKKIAELDKIFLTNTKSPKTIDIVTLAAKVALGESDVRIALKFIGLDTEIKKVNLAEWNIIEVTNNIKDKQTQKEILKKASEEEWGRKKIRETVKAVKIASPEVKKALFDDDITTEQAERISKLNTEASRKTAINEHKSIKLVDKGIEKNIQMRETTKDKKKFDKGLLQSSNWIKSFRNSVTDSRKELTKTIKVLLIATKFIPLMDDTQKAKLDDEINRLTEILEKGNQLAQQIQEKIKNG